MHALVLMTPDDTASVTPVLDAEHERFIDDLVEQNKVVLGGELKSTSIQYMGAYVVPCASLDEAREIAESDPLVRHNAIRCDVIEWELVGINVNAIDREALLYPELG